MNEFLEELKHNKNINIKNNIDNIIDIDYVLERLENIKNELLENIYYFSFHNKNLTKTQEEKILNIIENLTSKGVFK